MPCPTEIDDLMSLKLDGLIDDKDEQRLDEHLRTCDDCSLLWAAMKEADAILWASALEPLPVPADLHSKVMVQIAVSASVPAAVLIDPLFQPGIGMVAAMPTIVPVGATRRLEESPTGSLAGYADWQKRIASYVRGMAAVGLSLAGTVGLLLALMLSGTIKVSGPLADAVGTIRTFFEAIDTWVRSLFVNFGPGLLAVGVFMVGILALVGWQVVSGYHRSALENRGNTGVLEALA
jgi:Putative zinc-finger